jgi:hypothetical protein
LVCSRLILDPGDKVAAHSDYNTTFTSSAEVDAFFGSTDNNTHTIGVDFFAAGSGTCTNPVLKFLRFCVTSCRAHLYFGNLQGVTLTASGAVTVTSQGQTWQSSTITLSNDSLSAAASATEAAVNGTNYANLPVEAVVNASLAPSRCTFTGYLSIILNVTAVGTCGGTGPPIAAQLCDATFSGGSCTGGQLTTQQNMVDSLAMFNNNIDRLPCGRRSGERCERLALQSGGLDADCRTSRHCGFSGPHLDVGSRRDGAAAGGRP